MTVDEAVASLEEALEEEWPGEFLDPPALRVVLDELKQLQAMRKRAQVVAESGLSLDESESESHAARYILDPW